MLGTEAPKAPRPLGDLSGPWILFVDNHVVAERTNVTRRYHAFEKDERNPLLKNGYVMGTVLPTEEGHGYRMWYSEYMGGNTYRILYATSDDGIRWEKPELVLPPNNLVNPQVIHTPQEQPQRRYKLIYVFMGEGGPKYYAQCSPDGIQWTYAKKDPILEWEGSDVGNFVWDQNTKQYIGYPKMKITCHADWRRSVGFSATQTFESWPPRPKPVLLPDYIDDNWVKADGQRTDFYGLCGFAYESMYLGFLWIFQIADDRDHGPIFIELVTSHDGVNWRRQAHPRQRILSPGAGAWDGGVVYTTNHPLVEGGTIKLYYGGAALTHGYEDNSWAVGLATLRKDGFASLDAEGSPGSVLTRKCLGMRGPLHVNYKTNHGGSLRAEVLDASGKVVPGYSKDACNELKGDSVDAVVTWKHHTELPKPETTDHPLQIRFVLQDASLYSFAAGDRVKVLSFDSGVLYTFEGDGGRSTVRNKLCPGEQDGRLLNNVAVVVDTANSAFGTSALKIDGNGNSNKPNALEIPGTTNLGTTFTLSAMAKMTNTARTRIFTSYRGEDDLGSYEVLFDVDPSRHDFPGLRAWIHDRYVQSGRVEIVRDKYHHFAMTYDDGYVRLYFDGQEVGRGPVDPGGPVCSYYDLRLGQDWGGTVSGTAEQQFAGYMDDILVLPQALKETDIKALFQQGAELYLAGVKPTR
jgi:hypothetical protein